MVNKKGFIRILEAVIAIIIVLAFVVAVIPDKPAQPAGLPPDLEQTTNSVLREMRENAEFRQCVLGEEATSDFDADPTTGDPTTGDETYKSSECVYNYIKYITRPNNIHPWDYGVKICTGDAVPCDYYPKDQNNQEGFGNILPEGRDVYIKSTAISGFSDVSEDINDPVEDQKIRVLTIYAWSKS